MNSSDAPVTIGRVALTVHDLATMTGFYESVMGLTFVRHDVDTVVLGRGDRPLIELREDRAARPRPGEAGLFHTAFLLPDRAALAHWAAHARASNVRLDGASDHLVSEALYLTDPEGNGIEMYRDRPRYEWTHDGGQIAMATLPLNLSNLAHAATGRWNGAPDATVIGHVHLQVGDIRANDEFVTGKLGLRPTARLPSAGFYASGDYHHHLAGNIWNSRGAGPRTPGTTGLADVELLAEPDALPAGTVTDPWGTRFTVTAAPRDRAADGAGHAAAFASR